MATIWQAARAGDAVEVERLVGQDPGLLDARDSQGMTPLMWASKWNLMGVVQCLLDKGAATDERANGGWTALWLACFEGHLRVVRLLVEKGADPIIADEEGWTPLLVASFEGHLEVVRVLLGYPSVISGIDDTKRCGATALWGACHRGSVGVMRALLESGADPTIANKRGMTPVTIAKRHPPAQSRENITAEGRRECVAALEVRP
jgi:ankyrin repeat protein